MGGRATWISFIKPFIKLLHQPLSKFEVWVLTWNLIAIGVSCFLSFFDRQQLVFDYFTFAIAILLFRSTQKFTWLDFQSNFVTIPQQRLHLLFQFTTCQNCQSKNQKRSWITSSTYWGTSTLAVRSVETSRATEYLEETFSASSLPTWSEWMTMASRDGFLRLV